MIDDVVVNANLVSTWALKEKLFIRVHVLFELAGLFPGSFLQKCR